MLLYYITDRLGFAGGPAEQRTALLRCIGEAAQAEVDYIQLREKDLDLAGLELLAREALHIVRDRSESTKLLINRNVDVALAIGADGVHLPANSPAVAEVRDQWLQQTHDRPIVAVSAHTLAEVRQADSEGADFVALAPIFEKVVAGQPGIGLDMLAKASASARVPVLALGGVRLGNVRACLDAGAAGVAAIRLFQENGVRQTVAALRWLSERVTPP